MKHICIAISTIILCGLTLSACDRGVDIISPMIESNQSDFNQDNDDIPTIDGIPAIDIFKDSDGTPVITGNIDVGDRPDLKPYNPESDTDLEEGQEEDAD